MQCVLPQTTRDGVALVGRSLGVYEAWQGSAGDALGVLATFYKWEAFAFWLTWKQQCPLGGHCTTSSREALPNLDMQVVKVPKFLSGYYRWH